MTVGLGGLHSRVRGRTSASQWWPAEKPLFQRLVANTDNDRWVPALNTAPPHNPSTKTGDDKVAMVCEVTDLTCPPAEELIVRRELHPGAQTSLLPDLGWGHYDQAATPPPWTPDARGPHRPAQRLRPVAVPFTASPPTRRG